MIKKLNFPETLKIMYGCYIVFAIIGVTCLTLKLFLKFDISSNIILSCFLGMFFASPFDKVENNRLTLLRTKKFDDINFIVCAVILVLLLIINLFYSNKITGIMFYAILAWYFLTDAFTKKKKIKEGNRIIENFKTGLEQFKNQDYSNAFIHFEKAAEKGLPQAQYYLSYIYLKGLGVTEDEHKSFEWCQKAADQGHIFSYCWLGEKYEYGEGVEQDYNKALEWYTKGAENEDESAQYYLGLMYEKGNGVEKDDYNAYKWFSKAAKKGHAHAREKIFLKAAQNGDEEAQYILGVLYDSYGSPDYYLKAAEWYLKAAQNGYAAAQYKIGWMYENDFCFNKDDNKAADWYLKAAKNGDAEAQYKVGWMFENDFCVMQDYDKAAEWYQKAADQEHEKAKEALKNLKINVT